MFHTLFNHSISCYGTLVDSCNPTPREQGDYLGGGGILSDLILLCQLFFKKIKKT